MKPLKLAEIIDIKGLRLKYIWMVRENFLFNEIKQIKFGLTSFSTGTHL
jgi:hypothetical protein